MGMRGQVISLKGVSNSYYCKMEGVIIFLAS